MGNEQNNNNNTTPDHHQTGSYDFDFIAQLRDHFKHKNNQNNTKTTTTTSKKKIIKPKLPTCPICLMEVNNYKRLKNCNHLVCHDCLNGYISSDLKNISKYPLKCFESNCDEMVDFTDVQYALNYDKDLLFIFDKFSILCAISPTEREQCPKCEMVFFYQSKWQREKVKPFKWTNDNERTQCTNKLCKKKFMGFIIRRHHCRICGEIFCDECSSHLLPLSAASNAMLSKWIQTKKSEDEEAQNSKVHKASKWMKNIAASSTSHELWSSSDEEDEDNVDKKIDNKDKEEEKHKDEEKTDDPAFALSASEQDLIEEERVRCCYPCWLDYYRGICAECDYQYCIQCRQEWHNNYDCEEIKKEKKAIHLRKKLNDAQTEELMLREGWRRCAGCKVWVAKSEGCNHMTHENCPNPNEIEERKCHFCYCCGELLYNPYRKYEKNDKLHFENGVFSPCRNYDEAKEERDQLHDDVKSNIAEIENEFDENGIVIKQNDKECILM